MSIFRDYVNSKRTLTEKLLDEITDFDIYCELIGEDLEIGQSIASPVREDDTRASFSLYIPTKVEDLREDEVWWKDFAGGFGNVFQFVQRYAELHYGETLSTRVEVIKFLDTTLELGIFGGEKRTYVKRDIDYESAREAKEILFTSRKYTRRDQAWWLQFGIDEALLKQHDVRSVECLLNVDHTVKYSFRRTELAFAYVVYDKIKLYCPEETDFKWRNTCPADYLLGAQQTGDSDVLIITKSLKDIMSFKSFVKCDIVAPQSETWNFSEELVARIKDTYKLVYVVMDYDPAGIAAADRLAEHGFIIRWVSKDQVMINGKQTVIDKDISDFVKNNGFIASLELVKTMFNELGDSYFRNDRPRILSAIQAKIAA